MPLNFTANQLLLPHIVAPFTGAWIETSSDSWISCSNLVAPFTGAWIETFKLYNKCGEEQVAPFTGAWIETSHR